MRMRSGERGVRCTHNEPPKCRYSITYYNNKVQGQGALKKRKSKSDVPTYRPFFEVF
jgi:hypothetical protein